jgi:hypothetical protein
MKFEKGNDFIEACIDEYGRSYRPDIWSYSGPGILTKVFKSQKRLGKLNVNLLPKEAFYPVTARERPFCFHNTQESSALAELIEAKSYSVHFNGKLTAATTPDNRSLCHRLLNRYCIFCNITVT